jgi:hypothetical protein
MSTSAVEPRNSGRADAVPLEPDGGVGNGGDTGQESGGAPGLLLLPGLDVARLAEAIVERDTCLAVGCVDPMARRSAAVTKVTEPSPGTSHTHPECGR